MGIELNDAQFLSRSVQIGEGLRTPRLYATQGSLVIHNNHLTLIGAHDRIVAAAPMSRCRLSRGALYALTGGRRTRLTIGKHSYAVAVRKGSQDSPVPSDMRALVRVFKSGAAN